MRYVPVPNPDADCPVCLGLVPAEKAPMKTQAAIIAGTLTLNDPRVVRMATELYKVFWGQAPPSMEDVHWLAVARRAIELGAACN